MNLSAVAVMATLAPPSGKQPTTPTAKPISKLPAECLIVFGLDNNDRPHASWFGDDDMELARKAAEMMGMAAMDVTSEELRALAGQLPAGRVFASGRAFVPFVKGGLYSQLTAHLPAGAMPNAGGAKAIKGHATPATDPHKAAERAGPAGATLPAKITTSAPLDAAESTSGTTPENKPDPARQNDWSAIKAGDFVLAMDDAETGGWYEAYIVELRGDLFTLTWRDWPELGRIVRRAEHIALLHPAYIAASQ